MAIDYEDLETACAHLAGVEQYIDLAIAEVRVGNRGRAMAYLELAREELEGGWQYYRRENMKRYPALSRAK